MLRNNLKNYFFCGTSYHHLLHILLTSCFVLSPFVFMQRYSSHQGVKKSGYVFIFEHDSLALNETLKEISFSLSRPDIGQPSQSNQGLSQYKMPLPHFSYFDYSQLKLNLAFARSFPLSLYLPAFGLISSYILLAQRSYLAVPDKPPRFSV